MVTSATVATAQGSILVDGTGQELIDFASGIGVMTAGHCQPSVVEAIHQQAEKLLHACIHVATYEPYVALCEKLAELLPHGEQTKVMLVNSGAEAVENAIKIARQATNRPAVMCYTEGFHGRTLMAMSLTSKYGYKIGCGPYAPEIYRLPFPNHYRYGDGLSELAFVERELCRFRDSLVNTVAAEQVAAVILEVVQGEGGFVQVPAEYLRGLRRICDEHGILLILDEVQSGFCRTGRWAAYDHFGVVPDISTWAKAMGGGLPIGAVVGKAQHHGWRETRDNRWHLRRQPRRLCRLARNNPPDAGFASRTTCDDDWTTRHGTFSRAAATFPRMDRRRSWTRSDGGDGACRESRPPSAGNGDDRRATAELPGSRSPGHRSWDLRQRNSLPCPAGDYGFPTRSRAGHPCGGVRQRG